MIELSAQAATMLYLLFTLGLLLTLWVLQHLKQKKKAILPAREILCRCEYCHCAYTSPTTKKVTQCPECKSYNKANSYPLKK